MSTKNLASFATIVATACAVLSQPAFSQPPPMAAAPALDEIIVTAQKRSEDIQTVPIVVTAVTAAALDKAKIETTQDLQFLVPALVYNSSSGYAMPFLRGIGSDFTQPNADPSVATYIDGAYVASDQATIQNLLGVQRIEVLEGPQGTLYGRNAIGGAINILTLTPTQTTDVQMTLGTGNYARKELYGHISGGLSDDLAVGVYVAGTEMNPYISPTAPLDSIDPKHETQWGVRIKAVYTPTTRLTLIGSVEATKTGSFDENAYRQLSPNALVNQLIPGLPLANVPYTQTGGLPVTSRITQQAATLREEYDLDWAHIVGVSNYRNLKDIGALDLSAADVPLLGGAVNPQTSRQYSQELQLVSPSASSIKWIGGLFAFHERGADYPDETYSGLLFGPEFISSNVYGAVGTTSYAAFGETTVPLDMVATGLDLTLGVRYTSDHKSYSAYTTTTDASGAQIGPTTSYPNAGKTWNQFTPKVTVGYQLVNTLLYATYASGFKSGAFNLTAPTASGPVNPEKLNDFEIGEKTRLWDERVQLNSSLYYYDYKNLQVQITNFAQAGSTLLENAASAKAYGFESSLALRVLTDLTVNASIALAHTDYTRFPNYAAVDPTTLAATTVDATGNELQRAPKVVLTLGPDYQMHLPNGGVLDINAGIYYNGGYYWSADNHFKQQPYTLVNAAVAYTFPDDHWTVRAWGKNLGNRLYETGVEQIAPFGIYVQEAPPRMYGLNLTFATH